MSLSSVQWWAPRVDTYRRGHLKAAVLRAIRAAGADGISRVRLVDRSGPGLDMVLKRLLRERAVDRLHGKQGRSNVSTSWWWAR